jgi:hypothetical protein
MSIDLHDVFARAGQDGPASSLDPDLVVRQGRRLRARRRRVAASSVVLGVGVVVFGTAAVATNPPWTTEGTGTVGPAAGGSATSAPVAPPTVSASATQETPPAGAQLRPNRAGLQSVFLPDPAPGFPVRRADDSLEQMNLGEGGAPCWVRSFLLAVRPATEVTDSEGNVSGHPNGPEVTVFVGGMAEAQPQPDGTIDGEQVVATPTVAGAQGYLTQGSEKDTPRTSLYFRSGRFQVEIHGFGAVTPGQLVDLGDAIQGLPRP